MTTASTPNWIRDLKPGDRIIEKDHRAFPKTVVEVATDQYIVAKGFNTTRIAWRNLNRYRPA